MKSTWKTTVAAFVVASFAGVSVATAQNEPQLDTPDLPQFDEPAGTEIEITPAEEDYEIEDPAGAPKGHGQEAGAFLKGAAAGSNAEIALAYLAQEKAQNPQVKQFASRIARDHVKAAQDLKQIATRKGEQMDVAQLEELGTATGQQFDQAWLRHMVECHRKAISKLEEASRQQDQEIAQFARTQLTTMREHLREAERLQQQTGGLIRDPAGTELPGDLPELDDDDTEDEDTDEDSTVLPDATVPPPLKK